MPMKCPRCRYEWESKIPQPKECPRCKGRMDYRPGPVGAPKLLKKGGEKVMTNKLPWATAAVIIVVAAIGAWTIFGAAPAAPPTAGTAGVSATLGTGTVFGSWPDNSGIENIYIMPTGQTYTDNMADSGNALVTLTYSGDSDNIPYDTQFAIVVAVTGHTDNMGQLTEAYMKVALGATTSSTDWSIPYENSDDNNAIDEYEFQTSDGTWVRFNVVWDNNASYYQLTADDNLNISAVDLWLRGPVTG